jgi:hypothetical protein
MADVIIDGYINIWLVPTIPNIGAPSLPPLRRERRSSSC